MRAAVLALIVASSAWAQSIYTWTDAEGTQHFTNDPSAVPKNVKVSAAAGADLSIITVDLPADPPSAAPAVLPPAAPDLEVPSSSEQEWRRLFRDATLKIRQLEDEVDADRKFVEEVNGLPVTGNVRVHCGAGYVTPSPIVGANPWVSVTASGQVLPNVATGANTSAAHASAPCWYGSDPKFERLRQRLAKNRITLERAREDLVELEREASFASVPREWRR